MSMSVHRFRLGIVRGDPVQKAVRVRSHKSAPFSHITTFVPEAVCSGFSRKQLSAKPMLSLLGCILLLRIEEPASSPLSSVVGAMRNIRTLSGVLGLSFFVNYLII